MGKFSKGINGPFSGKVGPAVGSTWMGKPVLRSVPKKRTKPYSVLEIQQHKKFSLMSTFLQPLMPLFNITFSKEAVNMSGFNKGYSYNVKNAITGAHPDPGLSIDFSMVMLSRGDLPPAASISAGSEIPGKLITKWENNSGKGKSLETDKLFIAAFSEELYQWFSKLDIAQRKDETCSLDIPAFTGKQVHIYIGMIAENGKDVTDSEYAGVVNL